uniref:RRM domain-containing protein n=2 Tax=Leersia perrieri TaxID=77586 RepID=A0A0D9WLZ6_9ORYZ
MPFRSRRRRRERESTAAAAALLVAGEMSLSHHLTPGGDPYFAYAPHPHHLDPQRQGVLTLFVAGLPDDVKPREIHNLFSRRPGFDHCLLEYTGRGNQAVAFVSFVTHQAALSAMSALNGTVFDPETGGSLHIELAKSNSRDGVYRVVDKRIKRKEGNADHENAGNDEDEWGEHDNGGNDGDGGSEEPSDTENDDFTEKNELPAEQSSGQPGLKQHKGQSPSDDQPDKSSSDIPPCSTLFLANLGHSCTEEDLKEVLSKQPGFHLLKMRRRGGMPVAFADFMDVESSTAAMDTLQGTVRKVKDEEELADKMKKF